MSATRTKKPVTWRTWVFAAVLGIGLFVALVATHGTTPSSPAQGPTPSITGGTDINGNATSTYTNQYGQTCTVTVTPSYVTSTSCS